MEKITDISEEVYRLELGPRGVRSMLLQDKDDGTKLRNRAKVLNPRTVRYMLVLGVPIPTRDEQEKPEVGLFD